MGRPGDLYVQRRNLTISGGRFSWRGDFLEDVAYGALFDLPIKTVSFSGTKLVPAAGHTEIDLYEMFYKWEDLEKVDLSGLNISGGNLTRMKLMFTACPSLTEVTFGGFDTSKVTDMEEMFVSCISLKTVDMSGWNTASVKYFTGMFYECTSLESVDLSGWDTSSVETMSNMFSGCTSLKLLDLSDFDTSNVENMWDMFFKCENLETILVGDGWSTAKLTNGYDMFYNCYSLVGEKGTKFNWRETDKRYARIDDPDNGKPGYLSRKKGKCFGGYKDANGNMQNQAYWYMEDGVLTINGGQFSGSQWNDYVFHNSEGKEMQSAVSVSFSDTELTVESGTSTCTLAGMFSGWKKLEKADMSGLKINLLTDTSAMFYDCSALTEVKFGGGFYTSNVSDMSGMFADCRNLTLLDLRGFYTSVVTDMSMMFYNCRKLAAIIVGNGWSTQRVRSASNMFANDYSLVGQLGTKYNKSNDDLTYAHLDGGISNPGYLSETEPQSFGGVFENGEWRDRAYWQIDNNGNVIINGGQFTRAQWFDYIETATDDNGESITKAASITFISTAFAAEDEKGETSLSSMFNALKNLTAIDLSGLDTMSKGTLTSTAVMFSQCSSLTRVKFGGKFNTSKVKNMSGMFYACSALKTLFLSKLNTSNVTDMKNMFDT